MMAQEIEIAIPAEEYSGIESLPKRVASELKKPLSEIRKVELLKKSIDARKRPIVYRLKIRVFSGDEILPENPVKSQYKDVSKSPPVVIIGAGPAGLFAALTALEQGLKPIILERGKEVSERKRDNALLLRTREVNPNSNWCFGEGGAGTFSDGKLYTRSSKRGNVQNILQKLVEHGAEPDILYEAHPHIGTDKLSGIIANIRKTILECGGEYFFNTQVVDFEIKNGEILSAIDSNGNKFEGKAFLLATGHSAHDIFELFYQKSWPLEAKSFAMGVRAEHPQELINSIQYHKNYPKVLPQATYQLVTQVENRGVFSFCMCPGGIIVPAATDKEQMVVNGMSNAKRNSPFANAGIAVSISEKDIPKDFLKYGQLSLLRFQQSVEKTMFEASERKLFAPTQRMTDFVSKKSSQSLNKSTYLGGCVNAELHKILPPFIAKGLQKAFLDFDKKMRGYYTAEANLLGVESRTSSPVRIPRNENYRYEMFSNLYPCGEGAGYAGGIVSAAMDGCNCVEAFVKSSL